MIIAIDGPAGTGKSTIAAMVAKKLGITYLNSGSFYRALTLALNATNIDIADESAVLDFARAQKLEYINSRLVLNGTDVEDRLHDDAVSARVAQVSSNVAVRHLVNDRMREITKSLSIICEGRDMTTVVFPNADYKFYLDASIDVQAERRYKQGVSTMTLEEIKEAIRKRDEIDRNKAEGALKKADDAVYVDTSTLTIDDVCGIILSKIQTKGSTMEQMEVEKDEAQDSKGAFQTQFEDSLKSLKELEDGQLVDGTVIDVTDELVFVDIGYKSEGRIPVSEFAGNLPKAGDVVTVVLLRKDGRNGPEISKSKADAKQLMKDMRKAFDEKIAIDGTIEKEVKGGFDVNLGGDIHAFLPISQSDSQKVEKPEALLGLKSQFYIERLYSDSKANVVVNRRKYLEEQIDTKRDAFFNDVKIGDTVKGTVKSFTSFGAFIDLGGFDGLLHINDMSWGHVARPKDFVKKGQEIELKVIRLDPAEKRINLSLKHFAEDPWIHFEEKYHVNDVVKGKVTKLTDFGAFIELEEGIEGLVHISEFSWTKKINKPSDMVNVGDDVEVMILGYDIQAGRVSLGLKQVTANPWKQFAQEYKPGSTLEGEVTSITDFGVFVKAPNGIEGLVNKANLSEDRDTSFEDAVKKYNVGDKINVFVVEVNVEKEKVAFSVREFKKKQQRDEISQYMAQSDSEDDGAFTIGDLLKK